MLNNTIYQLKHNKKLRVAYFGGSITEGAGSSDPAKTCYRAITTAHLKEKYPDAEITEIYAAIGGTGTSLGMFRLNKDVLAHSPDLIFMEFAVNDFGDTEKNVLTQTEAIIRQIRSSAPMADVIFLFSTAEMVIEALDNGEEFVSREAQKKVAEHYNVPTVDFGSVLVDRVRAEGVPYTEYAPDTLHPNDKGYRVFCDMLLPTLDSWLSDDADTLTAHTVPEKLDKCSKDGGDILSLSEMNDLEISGFKRVSEKWDRFDEYAVSDSSEDSISFTFEGSGLGIYRLDGNENAELLVSIDGAEPVISENWNCRVRSFHKMAAAIVTKELTHGVHHVKLTVDNPDQGIVIGGVFVC